MKHLSQTVCFLAILLLSNACTTPSQPVDISQQKNEVIQIAPHKGRLTPETSVARSLKYNIQPIKQHLSEKFLGTEAQQNAFTNLRKIREEQTAGLATSQKELDFAIFYTAANYYSSSEKLDAVFNQIAAQNIVLGALNAHKNALFDHKKTFEIKRKIRQYQKQIATLIKKPSENNSNYQKKLEESIDNLNTTLITMQQTLNDFRQLVKVKTKKTDVEGQHFFETVTLQPQIKAADYQKAAFANRIELSDFPALAFEDIAVQYPEIKTAIETVYNQQSVFQQKLSARGDAQASVLLQTMLDYQKAGQSKKQKLLPQLNEELHKAIYLQIETAYQLALQTTSDYEIAQNNLRQIQQTIKTLEKISHPTEEQRIQLLQAKNDLLKNELLANQILIEKTMTVSALRFYNGQIKISPELLNNDISSIAAYFSEQLQQKFQQSDDTTNSLENTSSLNRETGWAQKENWLEDLMNQNQFQEKNKLMSTTKGTQTNNNLKTIMQLGAFLSKERAQKEWENLKTTFPELTAYHPIYEETTTANIPLFRLSVKSNTGGFQDICTKLRKNGRECFLRD